jgi:hypothetical protein
MNRCWGVEFYRRKTFDARTGHKVLSGKVLSTVAEREGIITGRREVIGARLFANSLERMPVEPPPLF